ncbi:hypothetical protein Hs30E_00530 [Lactococcus hodotermopsidis]|uniref:triacylglycerol lipase n=1 Tax=Pseudolactococcus hodotermopsidis TaxID=2709157 RepID=A0A6A0B869_9LACT|nr:triacylglycerol lipase [Lactococcus hodotermopsidis]GFH41502.1 hypothetical protein Hs30E_00530 [Lactococcus hodotermopsidis]
MALFSNVTKQKSKIFSLKCLLVATLFSFGFLNEDKVQADNSDPNIFVHGLTGFGHGELGEDLYYWGGTTQNIIGDLSDNGYQSLEAVVSPFGSNWDRSIELYYYIKGGTVDYGAAHAEEHGHARYGRTFPGIYPTWNAENKIHLIGHSQGGQTSRMLETLLREGSQEEKEYAQAHGIELPEIFSGNKEWVRSITTIATPHNGTQVASLAKDLLHEVIYGSAFIANGSLVNLSYDFKLDQWGLRQLPNESSLAYLKRVFSSSIWNANEDIVLYDLTTEGAQKLNEKTSLSDDVYYFSYSGNATYKGVLSSNYYPSLTMFPLYSISAAYIGATGGKEWRSNDGLVPVISALYPQGQAFKNADGNPTKGVWYVEPTIEGWEHMDFVGQDYVQAPLLKNKVKAFYQNIAIRNQGL